ncbi:Chondroitinase-B precursor [Rubripirellula tenax]|uniref:Chondroitinase-B n=1 Tax=Rubripirellula tenax TaxID=2528015 RepID=A0A5C6EMB7_9BACT|nr:polysaccharide lyase 6 family protein [Rubripirellula tenax]TWU48706.1 Chondroitinase-B precursor [Rubripirellula tenax]
MMKHVSSHTSGIVTWVFGLAMAFPGGNTFAADYWVSSAAEITTAMQNAQPGDVLVMANNGNWHNQAINFTGKNGTAAAAITLRAETAGQVKLTGTSNLSISGNYLVVDGLNFEGGTPADGSHVIRFTGSNGAANNSRVTNTQIKNYNAPSETDRTFWVSLYGQGNRVDHSTFQGQSNSGVTMVAWLTSGQAANHRIDSNYFADRPVGSTNNGYETIRIGDSATSNTNAGVVVENNLFQKVDGEIEIISNKSNDNIYRYNTIRESAGTLTLRHGDRATVEGNFILGNNKDGSGGVRVIGEDHKIFNNYISNVDDRADGAISITAGVPNTPLNGYKQVNNVEISNNSIVNPKAAAVTFDWGLGSGSQSLLAENVSLKNNLFYTNLSSPTPLFEGVAGAGWTWQNNIAFGASLGSKQSDQTGIMTVDPQLVQGPDGLMRPTASSPTIDAGTAVSFATDMDGQARIGVADIGADEYSIAQIVRMPLTAADVGTLWNTVIVRPTGSYFAVQAEDFSVVTDPNGDGRVWTTVADDSALGGFAIEAPSGGRTDLATSPHDTLAVYTLSFAEAETYTAYYRARGFNGSSDSLFAPDDFNTDPTLSESTTNNGQFRWEIGGTFEITASNVGMPLEFRMGRREGLTQLDAIVFHVDSALTGAQLDALFTTAVPEPSACVVLFAGLAWAIQTRRRRANDSAAQQSPR